MYGFGDAVGAWLVVGDHDATLSATLVGAEGELPKIFDSFFAGGLLMVHVLLPLLTGGAAE